MMRRLQGGSPPDADTRKLWLCAQLLRLRIRRPEPFGAEGAYAPLDAGEGTVAFTRGEREVLVAVAVRRAIDGTLPAVGGRWRDVLGGESVTLERPLALDSLVGRRGVTVLERA